MSRIIIPIGPPLSGKSTFAKHLPGNPKVLSFAEPIYRMLGEVVGHTKINYLRDTNHKEAGLSELGGVSLRYALQTLGTDWGRNMIWPDIWVDRLFREAEAFDVVVIDDLRFPNEYREAKERGGVFVSMKYEASAPQGEHLHESEKHHDQFDTDYTLSWETREELIELSKNFCQHLSDQGG